MLRHYGPAKTTIAEIAREAKIGVGTVYLEFASKDAIIEELSTHTHAAVLRAMREAAAPGRRSFADRLRAVLDARVEAFLTLAERGAHAMDLFHCQCSPVQSAYARFRSEEHALLAALLADGARAHEFDVSDPEATAWALLRAYGSFTPPWLFHSPREETFRMLRTVHHLVLQGLCARRPTRRR